MNIQVVEVTPEELAIHGGRPFEEVVRDLPDRVKTVQYNNNTINQRDRPNWNPPADGVYLPLNRAWLRNIDGRAYLYWQNW